MTKMKQNTSAGKELFVSWLMCLLAAFFPPSNYSTKKLGALFSGSLVWEREPEPILN